MVTVALELLDRQLQATQDSIHGSPSVYVDVTIGGVQVISGGAALVDTGAEHTVVSSNELDLLRAQLAPADKSQIPVDVLKHEQNNVFEAVVDIHGMNDPAKIFVVEKKVRHTPLVGRNLLQRYRLIYDPTKSEYSLTKP